jgi:hypothetical protein
VRLLDISPEFLGLISDQHFNMMTSSRLSSAIKRQAGGRSNNRASRGGDIMVQQFVDHFKTKEYGFNFFPVLGVVLGAMLADAARLAYFFLKDVITGSKTSFFYPMSIFYSLVLGLLLVVICHLVKDDAFLAIVFGLSYVVAAILIRLFSWMIFSYPGFYYREFSMAKIVFSWQTIIGSFIYALAIGLAVFLLYLIFKRLDYALLVGFLAGGFFSQLFYMALNLVTAGKLYLNMDYFFLELLEGALLGFFFYLGYTLYMRARGWRVGRGEVSRTQETTAARTRQLSIPLYFGIFLAAVLVELVCCIPVITRGIRVREAFKYSTGSFPPILHENWVIALSALGTVAMLFSVVIFLLFVYKMWVALQDGRASATPLPAALLLLVPVFNLYWIFKVIYGFAQDYNRLTERYQLNVPKLPTGLYLAFCLLAVLNVIALGLFWVDYSIPLLASYLQIAVSLAVMYLTCQAVNRIPAEIYGRPAAIRPAP